MLESVCCRLFSDVIDSFLKILTKCLLLPEQVTYYDFITAATWHDIIGSYICDSHYKVSIIICKMVDRLGRGFRGFKVGQGLWSGNIHRFCAVTRFVLCSCGLAPSLGLRPSGLGPRGNGPSGCDMIWE